MADLVLKDKKIAVLVETEYIPGEIEFYRTLFAEMGAKVDVMSNLWGNKQLTFVSDVDKFEGSLEETRKQLQVLPVDVDFTKVKVEDYAAVIMAANYTSVRLRWFVPPEGQKPSAEMARTAPAVKFFSEAMRNPRIIKGALCHGLWILTPTPELLAGRKVVCNRVMVADVTNAGGLYVPPRDKSEAATPLQPYTGVVVDGDLVTGEQWSDTPDFIQAIARQIQTIGQPAPTAPPPTRQQGKHSILVVLSERGYWGEELVGPVEVFDRQGYSITFATPRGRRAHALPPSMDSNYVDPPLGRPVTSPEMADKTAKLDGSARLDNPRSLADWLPERPYWSAPTFVRGMEAYHRQLDRVYQEIDALYDALLIVGGSGPIVDLVNNQRVHDLILGFYRLGKPIGAECYGVPCLAFARDVGDRVSLLRGKHVTGHCLEYDYKDGTGFLGADVANFNMGPPPYPLEYILRDATAPDGAFHGNFGKPMSVIVDFPFVTGRSTPDSYLTGEKMVEVLEKGLRQWGWGPAVYA